MESHSGTVPRFCLSIPSGYLDFRTWDRTRFPGSPADNESLREDVTKNCCFSARDGRVGIKSCLPKFRLFGKVKAGSNDTVGQSENEKREKFGGEK